MAIPINENTIQALVVFATAVITAFQEFRHRTQVQPVVDATKSLADTSKETPK